MNNIKYLFYAFIVLLLASCSDEESNTTPPVDIALTQNEQTVATKQNNFGFNLLRAAIKNETSPCIAVSPYSASQVLAMLANGANGETLSEIISALGDAGADINEINSYTTVHEKYLTIQKVTNCKLLFKFEPKLSIPTA